MRLASWSGLVLLLLNLCAAVQTIQAQEKAAPQLRTYTVIRAGTLIDPRADSPLHNQVIVIHGDKVESVGAAGARVPAGATVIDLSRATHVRGDARYFNHWRVPARELRTGTCHAEGRADRGWSGRGP